MSDVKRRVFSGFQFDEERYYVELSSYNGGKSFNITLSDDFSISFSQVQANYIIDWLRTNVLETAEPPRPPYVDIT